jgi:hypothetical protein
MANGIIHAKRSASTSSAWPIQYSPVAKCAAPNHQPAAKAARRSAAVSTSRTRPAKAGTSRITAW